MAGFTNWLKVKLKELNIDVDVFGSYITGILEDDDSREDKQEALSGLLEEILDTSSTQALIDEIFAKWQDCHPTNGDSEKPQKALDVDEQLARLLDQQKIAVTETQRQYTDEERKIKEQILAQYSQCSDEDDYVPEGEEAAASAGAGGGSGDPLMKNTNALDVANLAKEKREQQKIDSAAKKLKDKEDRDKQKQMREEKKEKRKTVKGERRR